MTTKYHLRRAIEPFYGIFHSRRFRVAGIALTLMVCFGADASAENWKLRIKNTTSAQIKVHWFCWWYASYYKKDTDTFPGSTQKTRELSSDKCSSASDLAVSIIIDNVEIGMRDCTYAGDWSLPGIVESSCDDGARAHQV